MYIWIFEIAASTLNPCQDASICHSSYFEVADPPFLQSYWPNSSDVIIDDNSLLCYSHVLLFSVCILGNMHAYLYMRLLLTPKIRPWARRQCKGSLHLFITFVTVLVHGGSVPSSMVSWWVLKPGEKKYKVVFETKWLRLRLWSCLTLWLWLQLDRHIIIHWRILSNTLSNNCSHSRSL